MTRSFESYSRCCVRSTHNSITYRANGSEIEVPSIPDLRGVFDPALLDDDGYGGEDRLREAMRAGKKLSP